jgi:hypothetical protein
MNIARVVAHIRAMASCAHEDFEYIGPMGKSAVGKCTKCRSVVPAAPSSVHYQKILAAKRKRPAATEGTVR